MANVTVQGNWFTCPAKGRTVHIEKLERGFYRITGYNLAHITNGIIHHQADIVTYATNSATAKFKARELVEGRDPYDSGVQLRLFSR